MNTRSIRITVSAIAAVALLLAASTVSAAPYTILYEGVLTSGGGTPAADGEYGMTFSMYTKASGGTAFWQESNVKVKVTGGVFQYALGSSKPIFAPPLQQLDLAWVGVKIGSDPELPRAQMHSVAIAHHAQMASGLVCTGCVSVKSLKFDDNLDLGSNGLKAKSVTAETVTAAENLRK